MTLSPQGQRRGRFSLFREHPNADTPDAAAAQPEERHELDLRDHQAAMARFQARRESIAEQVAPGEWRVVPSDRPLPAIDQDGYILLPPELIARQAAEAAEAEKQRIADLAPARLDALQTRRWVEWLARFEELRPECVELTLGPRGESEARTYLQPYRFEDTDERHPDGPAIEVSGVTMQGEPPNGHSAPVRAYPNQAVLDGVRQQYLVATWRKEWEHPRGPHPDVAKAVSWYAAEERKREAARRSGYGGYRGSGINW